jgi:penicillin amidase
VPIAVRSETLGVRGEADEQLVVRATPHGPIVSGLLGQTGATLSYRWTYLAAEQANELEGFLALDRAHDWDSFRAALRHFGAVAQNAVYADRQGHIGMQTCGAIPRLSGATQGTRLRTGWDGSQEWDGFWPFEDNPSSLDPPEGLLSSANNPTLPAPGRHYISSQWEPVDRITRIRELLDAKPRLSLDDLASIQNDFTLVSARELTPLVLEAFGAAPPQSPLGARALLELRGFDGRMERDAVAPTLFAAFYRRLFWELFEDELGPEIAAGYREQANLSAIMMRAVIDGHLDHWFDRLDTPGVEDRAAIFRRAFLRAVDELAAELGPDVSSWRWGRVHTLELQHPLGRASRLLARYFNLGPFPVSGHTSTVAKMEFAEADFRVLQGPSMRQLTDFADLNAARAVLPAGQSGLPASPHYDDMLPLWLAGRYHPLPMDPAAIQAVAESRLRLVP